MKLTNDDYISYEAQQKRELKVAMMNVEGIKNQLKWLDGEIKRPKKK